MFMPGDSVGKLSVVATPIGNLAELSKRAEECLRGCDEVFCEDTRRSIKLLNAYEIKKPLQSVPYFRERKGADLLLDKLRQGLWVIYVSDAGVPGLSDPGALLVQAARKEGFLVEVVGGPSALTSFIAGLGHELGHFRFVGFLPPKSAQREKFFETSFEEPTIFFESPHRLQKTLEISAKKRSDLFFVLAKELSKVSESFFEGEADELLQKIPSWKGEWIGLVVEKGILR